MQSSFQAESLRFVDLDWRLCNLYFLFWMIFGNSVLSDRYQVQPRSRHSNLQISHPFPPFSLLLFIFYWCWGSRPHLSILIFLLWHNHISKPFILFTRLHFWVTCLHSFLKFRGYLLFTLHLKFRGYLLFTLHFIIFTILTYFIMKEYVLLRIYISYLLLSNILAFHKLMCFSNRKDRINDL